MKIFDQFNGKKGMSLWGVIGGGLVMLVLVIIVIIIINRSGGKIGATASNFIDEFGDCDLDGVKNFMDKCPCTNFGANEAKAFRGCPAGTDEKTAQNDKQTCSWYVTAVEGEFVPNCEGENKEKCLEFENKHKTKCGQLEEKATELPAVAVKGESCDNCDLAITKFLLESKSGSFEDVDRIEEDLGGEDRLSVTVQPQVKNLGTDQDKDKIINNFYIGVFVCKDKKSCKPATFSGGDASKAWVLSGLAAGTEEKNLPALTFEIGTNGDYCDGSKDTSCYLKIAADSLENVKEKNGAGEDNNDKFIFISLKDKELKEFTFTQYKSLELFGSDTFGADTGTRGEIYNVCTSGIFGKDCESEDGDCDDAGDYPSSLPASGCLVQASQDYDIEENDCAYATAPEGFTLSSLAYKQFLVVSGVTKTSGYDADNLFQWLWKAKPEGSLLCKENSWLLCESSTAKAVVEVAGKKFACTEDKQWEPLQ